MSHLESSNSRVALVNGGSQQALPALRVIFVGQLACTKLHIQHSISGQDGPEENIEASVTAGNLWFQQRHICVKLTLTLYKKK